MKRLLYHLSKTDRIVISRCMDETKMHQRSLGFFVMLTALFAFISSYYALSTIFGIWDTMSIQYEMTLKQELIVTLCATLYALMIGSIDREIVSAKTKWAAGLRIPLALIIGVVISVPIELKILEDRINQKIQENHAEKMMPYKLQKDKFIEKINKEINDIEVQISYFTQKKIDASNRAAEEDMGVLGKGLTGIIGQGKHYAYAKKAEQTYTEEIKKLTLLKDEKVKYRQERLEQLDRDFTVYKTDAVYGLWEKFLVMHQIIEEDNSGEAKLMVWGISALFILLELIPAIIKLLSKQNDYDQTMEYISRKIQKRFDKALEEEDQIDDFIILPELRVEDIVY